MDLDKRKDLKVDTVLGSWFEGAEQFFSLVSISMIVI